MARINVAIKEEAQRKKAKHAARCEKQRGRALWEEKTTGYTRPAHFDDFMPRNRFHLLKKAVPFAFADLTTKQKDVWYMVTPVVKGFNENRRRTIRAGRVLTIDELMVAFRPRTSKRGGLPHLSFIMRKPKPPGRSSSVWRTGRPASCSSLSSRRALGAWAPGRMSKRPAARSPLAASA